ncbi:MAG: hypothetical protein WDO13_04190 [Verrucomicrobiota bacterium]
MGLFLSISGVMQTDKGAVVEALARQVSLKHGIFQAEPRATVDDDTLVLCAAHGNTTIYFPANDLSWWETSQALSRWLKTAVFAFHIHDGDLWMYELYKDGEKIDAFNPIPDYWMEISEEERESYRGDASVVAGCVPHLKAADIAKYFITWDLNEDKPRKAYTSDKHAYCDEWQLLDFMSKLKLPYPLGERGEPLGPTYEFIIPQSPADR